MHPLPLLLLPLLLHAVGTNVHTVVPNGRNTTCHCCHNLQYYLINNSKYFTSNTRLLFLPGLHHLHTDLIIQNVHNISLTSNSTIGEIVIQCNSSVGIVMSNITNLIVTNIKIRGCLGNEYYNATVLIKQCTNVQLRCVVVEESHNSYSIVGINILGNSNFSYITNNAMMTVYNDNTVAMENNSLTIDHYHVNGIDRMFQQSIKFQLFQQTYRVRIQLLDSTFQQLRKDAAISIVFKNEGIGQNFLFVKHCKFTNNSISSIKASVTYVNYQTSTNNSIWLQNCEFINNQVTELVPRIREGFISMDQELSIHWMALT